MEGLKVKTGQNATGTGDFERIEDGVRKLRRIAALLMRKTLACRLAIDGYPSEKLLELLKSGRSS
ncbi:hypothetical protein RSAG8_09985, partial [Rhizoctonia solani AG-8 WAC10335]